MAITRRSAITKDQQQQQQQEATPLPPTNTPDINSNNNIEPPQQQEQQPQQKQQQIEVISGYEQTREQRIKENRERLQKLGIVDLSNQLKSVVSTKRTLKSKFERKTPLKSPTLPSPVSIRRSSRLQNAPPVTYTEPKEEKLKKGRDIVLEEGAKPEYYTEEHDKLLGHTEMPWTFFVDGYRADGTRIYDPVNGKTCHQCRQKTMGQRTHCSRCNLVQGQFCGDCLMMRYGEHVVEANQNPNWLCPPCRGICNCSLCRQAKGWYPTGSLYKRVSNLGFKSVAHYLISTKRAPPESEKSSEAPQPAKRSLPFEGMELLNNDGSDDKAVVEGIEIIPLPDDEATTAGDSAPKAKGVGRPRKKAKIEIESAFNVDDPNTSTETVIESNSKPAVMRSGRKSTLNPNDGSDDKAVVERAESNPLPEDKATTTAESVPKSKGVGRPRKKSKDIESASNMNNPNTSTVTVIESNSKPAVRRSGGKSKNENADISEESVKTIGPPGDDSTSTLINPNSVDSKADTIGRRLRSSNRT